MDKTFGMRVVGRIYAQNFSLKISNRDIAWKQKMKNYVNRSYVGWEYAFTGAGLQVGFR